MLVAGVDGRRGGWAVATARWRAGRAVAVSWHVVAGQDAAGFRAVLDLAARAGATAVGVDCPVGLPSTTWRQCDLAAKRRLGRAAARVFLAPPRVVLAAPRYDLARQLAREVLDGRGVSAQAYGIGRVVLAVDAVLAEGTHPLAARVVEVHPELSFMAMSGRGAGDALAPKQTPAGRAARLTALGPWLAPGLRLAPPDGDDHLDALAAAWSAWRWARGDAEVLGDELDARGVPQRIVV